MSIMGFDRTDLLLIINLWRMSLADRYLGSALGVAWAILNPLLMFGLFTAVFGFVFKARLPGVDSTMAYSIWLICGYGPWLANSEALMAASNSIIANSGLVKNMSFKTELLPIASTMIGLVPLAVSICFLLGLQLMAGDGWQWSLIWLPFVVVVHFLFLSAFGVMIAIITTFVRDFGIVLPNLLMIVLFATPIFYPIETLPSIVQNLMLFNPIYIISSAYRAALIGGQDVSWLALLALALCSFGMFLLALGGFRRVKGFFPSVI
jgi:lipopolysaccharide transport system permease protein